MEGYYATINRRDDYDLLYEDVIPKWIGPRVLKRLLQPCFAMCFLLEQAAVVHLPFSGGPLGDTVLWRLESWFFKFAGVKIVVVPYGADAYIYSKVMDTSIRHVLITSYPNAARQSEAIQSRVDYWTREADVVICALMMDGMARWDVLTPNLFCIDCSEWTPKTNYSKNDGINGQVRVLHTPNHRGFKGTEFILQAITELRQEGFDVELLLIEKMPNTRVRELMQDCDILVEQLIVGYALSGIEGMASGLPVISNVSADQYKVFRRFSFLDECPIVSATPESIKDNLRALITRPDLRRELGIAGRTYAEKYHSYQTSQYIFGSIYSKIINREDVDLINLFHPLKSKYLKDVIIPKLPLRFNNLSAEILALARSRSAPTTHRESP